MIDLHTHSNASDGFLSPSELLRAAEELELEALALTDHDAVSGLKELHETARQTQSKVEIVNGAELSVYYPHVDMEILALDIPKKNLSAFEAYQQAEVDRRMQMAHKRIELLQNIGIDIEFDEVAKDEHGNLRTQSGRLQQVELRGRQVEVFLSSRVHHFHLVGSQHLAKRAVGRCHCVFHGLCRHILRGTLHVDFTIKLRTDRKRIIEPGNAVEHRGRCHMVSAYDIRVGASVTRYFPQYLRLGSCHAYHRHSEQHCQPKNRHFFHNKFLYLQR